MPATTPPKGRPTSGRRDRQVARRRSRSRRTTKKYVWGVLALFVLLALLVIGTGTGSDVTTTNAVLPLLLLRPLGLGPSGPVAPRRPRS